MHRVGIDHRIEELVARLMKFNEIAQRQHRSVIQLSEVIHRLEYSLLIME